MLRFHWSELNSWRVTGAPLDGPLCPSLPPVPQPDAYICYCSMRQRRGVPTGEPSDQTGH